MSPQLRRYVDDLQRAGRVALEALKAWMDHRASSKGAALAFYTLFSMAPILVVTIAVAGYFFGVKAAQGEIMAQVQDLLGPNGAQAIQALLAASRNTEAGLLASLSAGLVLIIGATTVFVELKASLDDIWGVQKDEKSPLRVLVKTRLRAFGLVLTLGLLLLISLVISAALTVVERYVGELWRGLGLLSLLAELLSFGVMSLLFAVIYKMLPEVALSWRDVWVGAAVTAGLFVLGKWGIGMYLGKSGAASSFGAAGSLIAVLLWVYYSAQIFFLGAEFTRQYALHFGSLRHQKDAFLKRRSGAPDSAASAPVPDRKRQHG